VKPSIWTEADHGGVELWRIDGDAVDGTLVKRIHPSGDLRHAYVWDIPDGHTTYMTIGRDTCGHAELWRTDGTRSGTFHPLTTR
jgi:hypothetical protein